MIFISSSSDKSDTYLAQKQRIRLEDKSLKVITRARRTTGAKGHKSNKAIIRFQKLDRSLNEIRNQC